MSERPKRGASMERSYRHAPIGLCYFDLDLRYVYINDWLANINGLTVQQHLGQRIGDILPEVAAGVESQLRHVIETGKPLIRGAAYIETPAHPGSRRHYEHSYHPDTSDDGTVVGLRCVVEDVTEHKRAEEQLHRSERRFRALVDQAPNAIVAIDRNRRVLLANPAAKTLFGYPGEDLLGQEIDILLPEELRGKHADHVGSFMADPQARPMGVGREFPARRRDGTTFPAEISLGPIETEEGLLVAATIIDVSRRVAAERLKDRLESEADYLQEELKRTHNFDEILGNSDPMLATLRKVEQVAPTDSTVLIVGETGTGKELLARAVHARSRRKDRPLIKIDCTTLPAGLVESELFGHTRGAFTGALESKTGRFELADGGTIFLDEIGELSLELQAKLLRVLQDGEFEPLGSRSVRKADVRIIAATNRNLRREMDEGRFRPDLYYRLSVVLIEAPPLRERREDIPLLVSYFVERSSAAAGKRFDSVAEPSMGALVAYDWPGNVRELHNVIERAVVLSPPGGLTIQESLGDSGPPPRTPGGSLSQDLHSVERARILRALQESGWKVKGDGNAASRLGLKPSTLQSRMKRLGITRP